VEKRRLPVVTAGQFHQNQKWGKAFTQHVNLTWICSGQTLSFAPIAVKQNGERSRSKSN
jgi:hypothetical protein